MTDAISNYGQRAQSDASLRSALDKANRKNGANSNLSADQPTSSAPSVRSAGADQLQLTNVAAKAMAEPDFDELQRRILGLQPELPAAQIKQFAELNKTLTARYPGVFSSNFHGIAVNASWESAVDSALAFLHKYVSYTGENILVRGVSTRDSTKPPVFDLVWPMNEPQPVLVKVLHCIMSNQ